MALRVQIIGALVAGVLLFGGGYWLRGIQADRDAERAANVVAIERKEQAEDQARRLAQARESEQAKAKALAELDAQATAQQKAAQHENEKLRSCIDSGSGCGLRVKVITAPATGRVPGAASDSSVGVAASAELDPAARQDYYALRAGLAEQRQQLLTCQAALRLFAR